MISVGGWTWSKQFSDAALTATSRQTFVSSCVNLYLKTYGDVFDGIDVDWEYPVAGGDAGMVNRPADRANYTLLMQEFRSQLNALEQVDGQNRHYELSIAAPAGVDKIVNLEVKGLTEPLDFINLMSYDFHGPWDNTTGFNAPMEEPAGAPGDARYDVVDSVKALIDAGAPASKVTLGVPFFGHGWAGVGTAANGLFQTATGPSKGTWDAGMLDYRDLAANYVGAAGWTRYWNDTAKSPYLWNASTKTFISYDDPESIRTKASWANSQGLGGVMFWDLSGDTPSHDLVNAVNAGLGATPTPTPTPTPIPTRTPTRMPTRMPIPTRPRRRPPIRPAAPICWPVSPRRCRAYTPSIRTAPLESRPLTSSATWTPMAVAGRCGGGFWPIAA
jgi:chitinase